MEDNSNPLGSLSKIQDELKTTIEACLQYDVQKQEKLQLCRVELKELREREARNSVQLKKYEDEIFELNEKFITEAKSGEELKECQLEVDRLNCELDDTKRKEKRKIELLKKELKKRAELIETLREEVKNGKLADANPMKKELKEKSKMVKSLFKRLKLFGEALEKSKLKHGVAIQEEKAKNDSFQKELNELKELFKKNPSEQVIALKEEVAECKQRVKDVMEEKWNWVQQKDKCATDLEILLDDYENMKRSLVEAESREQALARKLEKKRERIRLMDEDILRRNRIHGDLLKKTKEVHVTNHSLNEYVEKIKKKYKNLLLFHNRDHLLIENESLRKRLDTIEEWFDDAWAGFRLEVLNFERKLELKDEAIEKLRAQQEGREFTGAKPCFKET